MFEVALPVSLKAVFQTSLGFVDQIIVGTLGATAVLQWDFVTASRSS
jgi:Na+-driven multidrug efflux pump